MKSRLVFFGALSAAVFALSGGPTPAQELKFHTPTEVAREVKKVFGGLKTYQANFKIVTEDGGGRKNMSGRCYYQQPGNVRYDFNNPSGDFIVSNGKILWVYINRLKAVGKQDLRIKKQDENGRQIFLTAPRPGLDRLFSKYHYIFDGTDQPREEDGGTYFILDLEQREKIGGYEKIKLFVDAKTYLIHKAVATDGYGKKSTITFSDAQINAPLEGKLFRYKPEDNVRVVNNPLVND